MEDRDKVFSLTFGSPTREEIFEQWFGLFVTQCSLERIVLRCSMGCFINRRFIKRQYIIRQFINRQFNKGQFIKDTEMSNFFSLYVTQCSIERIIVLRCSMGCFKNRQFIFRQFNRGHFIKDTKS